MQYLNLSLPTPEENLALDEALLELCEEGFIEPVLRIWESQNDFVVLGYSSKISEEVHLYSCQKNAIPILRRPSGGCTVLQGPGCLNYCLIIPISDTERLNISHDNQWIMNKNKNALQTLSHEAVEVRGVSDLTLGNLKFSGNAQRRLKKTLLFHGTVLYNFDLKKISTYLKNPGKQPEYRNRRDHAEFIRQFSAPKSELSIALKKEWNAGPDLKISTEVDARIQKLISEKYSQDSWNKKFI